MTNPPQTAAGPTTRPAAKQPRKAGWTIRIPPDVDLASIPAQWFKMAAVLERPIAATSMPFRRIERSAKSMDATADMRP